MDQFSTNFYIEHRIVSFAILIESQRWCAFSLVLQFQMTKTIAFLAAEVFVF